MQPLGRGRGRAGRNDARRCGNETAECRWEGEGSRVPYRPVFISPSTPLLLAPPLSLLTNPHRGGQHFTLPSAQGITPPDPGLSTSALLLPVPTSASGSHNRCLAHTYTCTNTHKTLQVKLLLSLCAGVFAWAHRFILIWDKKYTFNTHPVDICVCVCLSGSGRRGERLMNMAQANTVVRSPRMRYWWAAKAWRQQQ